MNYLLAAIACHRAAQACLKAGKLMDGVRMRYQCLEFLKQERALRALKGDKHGN